MAKKKKPNEGLVPPSAPLFRELESKDRMAKPTAARRQNNRTAKPTAVPEKSKAPSEGTGES